MSRNQQIFKMFLAVLALLKFSAGEASLNEEAKNPVVLDSESQSPVTLETQLSMLIIPSSESSKFLQMTPFATDPNGTIQRGEPSVVPAKIATVQLKSLVIEHPKKGNYVVGVFVTLDPSSEALESSTYGFNGAVVAKVGDQVEYAMIPSTIVGAPFLNSPHSAVTVSTNFEMPGSKGPVAGHSDGER